MGRGAKRSLFWIGFLFLTFNSLSTEVPKSSLIQVLEKAFLNQYGPKRITKKAFLRSTQLIKVRKWPLWTSFIQNRIKEASFQLFSFTKCLFLTLFINRRTKKASFWPALIIEAQRKLLSGRFQSQKQQKGFFSTNFTMQSAKKKPLLNSYDHWSSRKSFFYRLHLQ